MIDNTDSPTPDVVELPKKERVESQIRALQRSQQLRNARLYAMEQGLAKLHERRSELGTFNESPQSERIGSPAEPHGRPRSSENQLASPQAAGLLQVPGQVRSTPKDGATLHSSEPLCKQKSDAVLKIFPANSGRKMIKPSAQYDGLAAETASLELSTQAKRSDWHEEGLDESTRQFAEASSRTAPGSFIPLRASIYSDHSKIQKAIGYLHTLNPSKPSNEGGYLDARIQGYSTILGLPTNDTKTPSLIDGSSGSTNSTIDNARDQGWFEEPEEIPWETSYKEIQTGPLSPTEDFPLFHSGDLGLPLLQIPEDGYASSISCPTHENSPRLSITSNATADSGYGSNGSRRGTSHSRCSSDLFLTIPSPPSPRKRRLRASSDISNASISPYTISPTFHEGDCRDFGHIPTAAGNNVFQKGSSFTSPRDDSGTSESEDETDWGDGSTSEDSPNRDNFGTLAFRSTDSELSYGSSKEEFSLSLFRRNLVESIMQEFWVIFNQREEANGSVDAGPDGNSPSDQGNSQSIRSGTSPSTASPAQNQRTNSNHPRKHQRNPGDGNGGDDNDERSSKRPKDKSTLDTEAAPDLRFSCPYRKHNPRKYNVQHWRSCALTPLDTVARVKGHLYRFHRIFPCQRCKTLFPNQEEVNKHLEQVESCTLNNTRQADGVTSELVDQIRSRKKSCKNQTEADRWIEIYKLLFPNEIVPSPYFEPVQDDPAYSPDSRALADYEEYSRHVLPRLVRESLESILSSEAQPIEEMLRRQLPSIVRDCQDRVFSQFRSTIPASQIPAPQNTQMQPPADVLSSGPSAFPQIAISTSDSTPSAEVTLPSFFEPPVPQTELTSALDSAPARDSSSNSQKCNQSSDSGYGTLNSAATAPSATVPDQEGATVPESHVSPLRLTEASPVAEEHSPQPADSNNSRWQEDYEGGAASWNHPGDTSWDSFPVDDHLEWHQDDYYI